MFKIVKVLLLLIPSLANASDDGLARSAGKYSSDISLQLSQQMPQQLANISILKSDSTETSAFRIASHAPATEFEIFDAWVDLSGDLDDDGFYHNIRVTFDADTNSDLETVYVKLFLSREGGPWYQYADSDLFEIHQDSADDSYEVLTELLEGYQPGYYDVLIELHSLYHPGIVASYTIESQDTHTGITLEDLEHDEYYRDDYAEIDYVDVSYGAGVSGSFSYAGLILLGILLIIKLRYFSTRK